MSTELAWLTWTCRFQSSIWAKSDLVHHVETRKRFGSKIEKFVKLGLERSLHTQEATAVVLAIYQRAFDFLKLLLKEIAHICDVTFGSWKITKNSNFGVQKKLKSFDRFFSISFSYFVFGTYNIGNRPFPTPYTLLARSICAKIRPNE